MNGDIYLMTGASSDMAIEYIRHLDEKKVKCTVIAIFYSSINLLKELEKELKYVQLDLQQCNLIKPDEVDQVIGQIKEKYDTPSYILHFAASKIEFKKLKELSIENMNQDLQVQVLSIARICQSFVPGMAKRKRGKIVFMISSCTIGNPPKYLTEYTTVKYALLGLMKSLACEYAGKGVTINGVSPSMAETKLLSKIDERSVEMIALNHPMKRNVEIGEIVECIDFLCSNASNYMNGVNLNLSGGQVI